MTRQIEVGESTDTQRRVYFHLVDVLDGITPETGEAGGQPEIAIDGPPWTAAGIGLLVALGHGRYYAELAESVVDTIGRIIETRYKSVNTAECPGDSVEVVAPRLTTDDIISQLSLNIPALSRSRTNPQTALISISRLRGYTKDITLLNSAEIVVAPITADKLRAVIGREGEIEADLSGAMLVVESTAPTAAGSYFAKNTPSSGVNRLRLDAGDLTFPAGFYTLYVDYFDSADADEWKTVERHTVFLEPT